MSFKYDLGQVIHYLSESRSPLSAPVLSRMSVENAHESMAYTDQQKDLFTHWGLGGNYYRTIHGVIREDNSYPDQYALIKDSWDMM